jgi:hypothetical protein
MPGGGKPRGEPKEALSGQLSVGSKAVWFGAIAA